MGNEHLHNELTAFPGLRTAFQLKVTFPTFQGTSIEFAPAMSTETRVEQRDESGWIRSILASIKLARPNLVNHEVRSLEVPAFGDLIAGFFKSEDSGLPSQSELVERSLKAYVLDTATAFRRRLRARIDEQHGGYQRAIDHSHRELGYREQSEQQALARHKTAVGALLLEQSDWIDWEPAAAKIYSQAA